MDPKEQASLLTDLSASMRAAPDCVALQDAFAGVAVTWGELHELSVSLGAVIAAAGLPLRPRIAMVVRQPLMAAVALVTAFPVATAAPINPEAPLPEQLRAISALRCSAVLADASASRELLDALASRGLAILEMQPALPQTFAGQWRFALTSPAALQHGGQGAGKGSDDPELLLLQTSGSTGRPKTVPLTSRQLGASARNVARQLGLSPDDLSLNVMPLHHSHGIVGVLLSSLVAGGRVAYLSGFEPAAFFEAVTACRPTWFSAAPTLHRSLVDWAESHPGRAPMPPLRFVRSTSAALPAVLVDRIQQLYRTPLVESYGMTEWSQIASNGVGENDRRPGTVGRATGVEIALRTADGRIDSAAALSGGNAEGELLIRGDGVSGGYDGDPEAVSDAWIEGWFRTGDLARIDQGAFIRITGRLKDVVNRGGEKVAPLEVEQALLACPGVSDAAVFGVPHPTLGEDLLAVVVPVPGMTIVPDQIRQQLFSTLDGSRVPTAVHCVASLPRSETGKILRERLAELVPSSTPVSDPARSDVERTIAGIMATELGCDTVARTDNFFRLGGDSIRGLRTVMRINRTLGVSLRPAALFRLPTVEALAREVERLRAPPPEDLEARIASMSDEEVARLLREQDQKPPRLA